MNFPSMLIDSSYALAEKISIFMKPGYAGIAYSDGDTIENRIANIIAKAQDLSIFSRELAVQCTDWPSLYHLSGTRANILRPFHSILKQANVLEIGAGCGAITRYLGESGANVLALEGSPRRAAIARSRTRELENVTVVADKFDQFQCDLRFDIITLIGVLEYAALFTDGENPVVSMLTRVRELLKPKGRLILAIENQLGLKYFAGAAEDHTGEPMLGIEGRYTDRGPRTFGRKALKDLLERSGFLHQYWMVPFPDYKLPVSILTEKGLDCDGFDSAALAWQAACSDPQLPQYMNFAPELAWPEVVSNDLTLDLANSFLVITSTLDSISSDIQSFLAYHYSTRGRQAAFCKETLFTKKDYNRITVRYNPLDPNASRTGEDDLVRFHIPEEASYIQGQSLAQQLLHAVTRTEWAMEDVGQILRKYLEIVQSFCNKKNISIRCNSVFSVIPGECIDIIPQNIIITADGSWHIIDQEWEWKQDIPLGWLIFRSFLPLFYGTTRFVLSQNLTRLDFAIKMFQAIGLSVTREQLDSFDHLEKSFQFTVSKQHVYAYWNPEVNQKRYLLQQHFNARENELITENQQIKEKNQRLNTENHKLKTELDQIQFRFMSNQIQRENKGTVSWFPSPLRAQNARLLSSKTAKIAIFLDRISRSTKNQLSSLYQALQRTPLFDAVFYMQDDTRLLQGKADPIKHYFFHGAFEGRNPTPYFFTAWYLAEYPDVAASGINPFLHFLLYGVEEGRNPNPYFFTTWYLNKYPQTKQHGIHPLIHYTRQGWQEGSWPNPYFDVNWYKKNYLSDNDHIEPLSHFLSQTPESNFNPNPHFDSSWYLQSYPWVRNCGIHPFQHYITRGLQEQTDPNAYFDSKWYAEEYPEAVRGGLCQLAHYLEHASTGRVNPNPYFDSKWYLDTYQDVKKNSADPLLHYILCGAKELRDPSPFFNTSWYLSAYPDVKQSGINPLLHFITFGAYEFRDPSKDFNNWYLSNYSNNAAPNEPPLLNCIKNKKKFGINFIPFNSKDSIGDIKDFIFKNIRKTKFNNYEEKTIIDIIIPIFNGFEFLENLFKTIHDTSMMYRIIAIDDKSSDPRISKILDKYKSYYKNIQIIHNENNVGFTKSVNIGLNIAKESNHHAVIINTDVEVPHMWLERIIAPILYKKAVASVTPFTNSGTICSFPKFCYDNALFEGFSLEQIDEEFRKISPEYPTLPTGVGFCMALNVSAIKEVGLFDDETFGKGYGEENDWCMRAINAGFINVQADNLFVYHKHGGSFPSEEKIELQKNNHISLLKKYPNYDDIILRYCMADTLHTKRLYLQLKLINKIKNTHTILSFSHNLGGGAEYYLENKKVEALHNKYKFITVRYIQDQNIYTVSLEYKEYRIKFTSKTLGIITDIFKDIDEIIINELVTYPEIYDTMNMILKLKYTNNAKLIMRFHDFFSICPTVNLLNKNTIFCNVQSGDICNNCLKENPYNSYINFNSIEEWRDRWNYFFQHCDEITMFSKASKLLFEKVYNHQEKITIVPHKIIPLSTVKVRNKNDDSINIGIVGALNYAKGWHITNNIARLAETERTNIKIFHFGPIIKEINHSTFKHIGKYNRDDLPSLLSSYKIDIIFISSVWPETFSYTTEEAISMGLPVVAFDIGAPPERLHNYDKGLVIPLGTSSEQVLAMIETFVFAIRKSTGQPCVSA